MAHNRTEDSAMNTRTASTTASNSAPLTVIHVPFHGDSLEAVQDSGKVWVPVSRLCESLGLGYSSQLQKLKDKPWATVTLIVMVAEDGKIRETACLDLDSLPMWLATIDVKRVAPAAREKLVVYQRECAKVLREYFFRKCEEPKAVPSRTGSPFGDLEPFDFFPMDDDLTIGQRVHLFAPKFDKENNIGHRVRRAIGLREGDRLSDESRVLRNVMAELQVVEMALRSCGERGAKKVQRHLVNLLDRYRGFSEVQELLELARKEAEMRSRARTSGADQVEHERAMAMIQADVCVERAKSRRQERSLLRLAKTGT